MAGLVLLFVLTQIVEIWILIQVAHVIGGADTLLLLVVEAVLGAALLRREGRRSWRALRRALRERRVPAQEVADGALVLLGGALLITPGLLSDVVGVLCLLPVSRAALRPVLTRAVARRLGLGPVVRGPMGRGPMGRGPMGRGPMGRGPMGRSQPGRPDVVDGEVVDPP